MKKNSQGHSASVAGASKKPVATILLALALSLATWYFFHLEAMPLTAGETTFVVGVWVTVLFVAKRIWRGRINKRRKSRGL
jgi:hypothetical protein